MTAFVIVLGIDLCSAGEPARATPTATRAEVKVAGPATATVQPPANSSTNRVTTNFELQTVKRSLTPIGTADIAQRIARSSLLVQKQRAKETGALKSLFLGQAGNGNFTMSRFEAGFGQVYDSDSVVLRGHNGTTMEEPSYLFVKTYVKF